MKLVVQIRLLPSAEQKRMILETMKRCNAAASYAAKSGFDAGVFSMPSIHKRCYYELREKFGLSSQMAVRSIHKASDCFATDKTRCPKFKPLGSIAVDERLFSFKGIDRVSILTLEGRQIVPIVFGEYQRTRLNKIKGQADLVCRDGKFYLLCGADIPEGAPVVAKDFVGVDLGVVNIAATSDGTRIRGDKVESVRKKYHGTRQSMSRKMSRSSERRTRKNTRRAVKQIGNKEARFRRHENHVISKTLVAIAKGSGRGIALEDLKGIRSRTRFKRSQRARMGGWAFLQLRQFIEYKAKLEGVQVIAVNPRNTSRTCSACGHCDKANRKSQGEFECQQCGHAAHADHNAAINIAAAASVNMLEVSETHRDSLVA